MNDKPQFDLELVELMVDEYDSIAQGLYPDLADSLMCCGSLPDVIPEDGEIEPPEDDMRDALADTMADRIWDEERNPITGKSPEYTPEFGATIREAARRIAVHYCGAPSRPE